MPGMGMGIKGAWLRDGVKGDQWEQYIPDNDKKKVYLGSNEWDIG